MSTSLVVLEREVKEYRQPRAYAVSELRNRIHPVGNATKRDPRRKRHCLCGRRIWPALATERPAKWAAHGFLLLLLRHLRCHLSSVGRTIQTRNRWDGRAPTVRALCYRRAGPTTQSYKDTHQTILLSFTD